MRGGVFDKKGDLLQIFNFVEIEDGSFKQKNALNVLMIKNLNLMQRLCKKKAFEKVSRKIRLEEEVFQLQVLQIALYGNSGGKNVGKIYPVKLESK